MSSTPMTITSSFHNIKALSRGLYINGDLTIKLAQWLIRMHHVCRVIYLWWNICPFPLKIIVYWCPFWGMIQTEFNSHLLSLGLYKDGSMNAIWKLLLKNLQTGTLPPSASGIWLPLSAVQSLLLGELSADCHSPLNSNWKELTLGKL